MKANFSTGSKVMVRLALLSGMPAQEPTAAELSQFRAARTDPALQDKLFGDWRTNDPAVAKLTPEQLSARLHLYPRRRSAEVKYAETNDGNVVSVNLEVKTPGSTVNQQSIGRWPNWALETFRLSNVAVFDKEPEEHQDIDVAYPIPE